MQHRQPLTDCVLTRAAGQSKSASAVSHRTEPLWIVAQFAQSHGELPAFTDTDCHPTGVIADQSGHVALRVADEYRDAARCQDAVDLAGHDQALQGRKEAHQVNIGCRQAVGQELRRLVRLKMEVIQALQLDGPAQFRQLRASTCDQKRELRVFTQDAGSS
jgi:hypothetical protein